MRMHPAVAEAIRLFNSQRFFEAHEALEALWLKTEGEEKLFLHGLIQVAAAFHHLRRGNGEGFRSLLEKGVDKVSRHAHANSGIDSGDLLGQLEPWVAAVRANRMPCAAPLPTVRVS